MTKKEQVKKVKNCIETLHELIWGEGFIDDSYTFEWTRDIKMQLEMVVWRLEHIEEHKSRNPKRRIVRIKSGTGIRMVEKDGVTGFTALCCVCGEQVKAINANVIWMMESESTAHLIACKQNSKGSLCTMAIQSGHHDGTGAICLDQAIYELAINTGANLKEAARRAKFLHSF